MGKEARKLHRLLTWVTYAAMMIKRGLLRVMGSSSDMLTLKVSKNIVSASNIYWAQPVPIKSR